MWFLYRNELGKYAPISKSSSDQQPFHQHSDSTKTNTDLSEGSTNTEDYVTCTDASKRGIILQNATNISSTTQIPGSNQ